MGEDMTVQDLVPSGSIERTESTEWETRVDLAACYRLVALYGMSDLVYNHISARVPNHHDQFFINAYGYLYEEITASSLYKIDIDGNVIDRPANAPYGINQAGFVIHSAVHAARKDVACVIHTHARASMAVSMMECGLLPISQHAMRFYGDVGYHPYESVALDLDERARLVDDLGDKNVMFLQNHGLLVCGVSIPEAFNRCYWIELACKAQIDAMSSGAKLISPSRDVAEKTAHLFDPEVRRRYGEMEWSAMLRKVDRIDPTYRN
jgi:ribulose-5-phosphate 4-epimerase/fuculose-1-phosphate aldolase